MMVPAAGLEPAQPLQGGKAGSNPVGDSRRSSTATLGVTLRIASIECDDDIADQFAALDRLMGVSDAIEWETGGNAVLETRIDQQLLGRGDGLCADGRRQLI